MKILIVEDEPKVASFIAKGLMENGYDCAVAMDGEKAWSEFVSDGADLILIDINLPVLNGLELTKRIREAGHHTPILMLTAMGSTEDKLEGFNSGADDYLLKPFEFVELLARVKALLKRSSAQQRDERVLHTFDLELNLDTKSVVRSGKNIQLTAKEFALLEFLLRNKGKVMSKSEIASKVWDIHFDTGTNVIEVYINFLRKKIDKDFEPKLIITKVGMGYQLRND
jgi:two-component system, OmpR family, copper resistance phosphate regulon response regulator CusR